MTRQADSVESMETVKQVREAGEYALLMATEPLAQLSLGWQPPSETAVSFSSACCALERRANQMLSRSVRDSAGCHMVWREGQAY